MREHICASVVRAMSDESGEAICGMRAKRRPLTFETVVRCCVTQTARAGTASRSVKTEVRDETRPHSSRGCFFLTSLGSVKHREDETDWDSYLARVYERRINLSVISLFYLTTQTRPFRFPTERGACRELQHSAKFEVFAADGVLRAGVQTSQT